VEHLVSFVNADALTVDVSAATVVTLLRTRQKEEPMETYIMLTKLTDEDARRCSRTPTAPRRSTGRSKVTPA
jgi:hypothetical protein